MWLLEQIYHAVKYIRSSCPDDASANRDTIANQSKLIDSFLMKNPDIAVVSEKIDENYSGLFFDRPAFNEMMEDIISGAVNCVIVKDLSRFGRNMIDVGYYIEKFFPSAGVRFISINDNYDSHKNTDTMRFVLMNLLSESYSLDIGRKVKSVIHTYMESGRFIGGRPPFGYLKSLDDCHKLIIDEPAAMVVKQIFRWAKQGKKILQIARMLNSSDIPAPGKYRLEQGIIKHEGLVGKGQWQSSTVSRILSDEVYIGNLVQGKTKIKYHKKQAAEPEKWIRVENTHESIVSKELFESVQGMLHCTATPAKKPGKMCSINLFKGKIFCAHCGGRLDRKKQQQRYIYRCTAKYAAPDSCPGNSIAEEKLVEMVSNLLIWYSDTFSENISSISETKQEQAELAWLRMETSNSGELIKSLYESLASKIIDEREYLRLREYYQQILDENKQHYAKFMLEQTERRLARARLQETRDLLDDFEDSMRLTEELVGRFIDKIEVSRNGKVFVEFRGS